MRITLIGLGTIAHHHIAALQAVSAFQVCGVCDIDPTKHDDPAFAAYPFFCDPIRMLDTVRPQAAVIATPPATHFALAMACVERGVLPMVEKPLASSEQEGRRFFEAPLANHVVPVCHTVYGEELLWCAKHLQLQHIEGVESELLDPYAPQGCIEEPYLPLGGCWLDSAPNALAPMFRLIPPQSLTDIRVTHLRDTRNGLPYASELLARVNEAQVHLSIRWDKGQNSKRTLIYADGKEYVLDHSHRAVMVDGETIFSSEEGNRLTQQYVRFYSMYPQRVPDQQGLKRLYDIIYNNL